MATSRLKIYNGALLHCKVRSISDLSVNEESRRLLDEVWNDGGVRFCLERGQWRFAMRGSQFYHDTSVTPQWGYRYAFAKPSDWVDTSAVCSDEYFRVPLLQYNDEAGYWFADIEPIYVKYVSDDNDYGSNLALWPYSFTEYVKAYFAGRIAGKVGCDTNTLQMLLGPKQDGTGGLVESTLITAKNRDAMAGPTTFPANGRWTQSRWGQTRGGPLGDGGSPGSLIG